MRVGILGGGQLGKMLALSGSTLGLSFSFYDPDVTCCARELAPSMHASFLDHDKLTQFAHSVDIITYENENVPVDAIQLLQNIKPIFPSLDAIRITQDRLLEKECLQVLGVPTTAFFEVNTRNDLQLAAEKLQFPFILKTRRQGYDGKGQVIIRSQKELNHIQDHLLQSGCIGEAWVNYRRELSVIAVRSQSGATSFYDVCENQHKNGILMTTHNKIKDVALSQVVPFVSKLLDVFSYCGVMTVEFFEDYDGCYLVNEIAPRVHNSGHWTIEGAFTSQFQNHLRAGLDLPLGNVRSQYLVKMENIIGKLPNLSAILAENASYLHLYGKMERPGRKLGHITRIIS